MTRTRANAERLVVQARRIADDLDHFIEPPSTADRTHELRVSEPAEVAREVFLLALRGAERLSRIEEGMATSDPQTCEHPDVTDFWQCASCGATTLNDLRYEDEEWDPPTTQEPQP
jgi:hypothetical protein